MNTNKTINSLIAQLQQPRDRKEVTEEQMEKWFIFIPVIFLFGVFISLIYPATLSMPIFLFVAIMMSGSFGLYFFGTQALRMFSIGFVSPIHHSSLRRPGPLKIVRIISQDGLYDDFGIFDLGGISVNFFAHDGGGKSGYYVVPSWGYIIEGGSVTVLNSPIRYSHNQLPLPIKKALLEHVDYKIGDPVYMALLPPIVDSEKIRSAFNTDATTNAIKDITLMLQLANEHAVASDTYRRTEQIMASYKIRGDIKNRSRRNYVPISEEEADREDDE